ncbi:MAG: ABC transporter ATP-binding protein [Actinobacteria bacterium]|nr:ABC transporter ATP-binding protein [Actinomycetota bacterium]
MTEVLAQCAGVTRRFGHFTAVDGVDLQVRRGEVVGLLGANGAGKTTVIRMLLGLLHATAGQVWLFGEPPSRRTRQRLGYVPQGLGLYDDLTPAENLGFSAAVFGQPGTAGRSRRAREAGRAGRAGRSSGNGRDRRAGGDGGDRRAGGDGHGGLPEPLRRFGQTLVGSLPLGVQRAAAFAEALDHRPDLLILDEPSSGVDPLGRARLWETVAEAAGRGAGVLVTTHYLDEAGECDRLLIMAAGRVVAAGTAAEITAGGEVTVVESGSWAEAFGALEAAGLPAALVGRTLRVPGAPPDQVRRALGGLQATVRAAPATLEESFFQLTLAGDNPGGAR